MSDFSDSAADPDLEPASHSDDLPPAPKASRKRSATRSPEPAPRSGRSSRLDRTLVRAAAAKAVELAAAPAEDLALLAALLGVSGEVDIPKLTVAVMASTSGDLAAATSVLAIADADPLEAGVLAAAMDRTEIRTAMTIINMVNVDGPNLSMEASDTRSALAVARAVQTFAAQEPIAMARLRDLTAVAQRR